MRSCAPRDSFGYLTRERMVSNVASLAPDRIGNVVPSVGDQMASAAFPPPVVMAAMAAISAVAALLIAVTAAAAIAAVDWAVVLNPPRYVRPRPLRPDVAVRQDTTDASWAGMSCPLPAVLVAEAAGMMVGGVWK